MCKYYARLFAELRRVVFFFWKQQIFTGLFAGAISAIIDAIHHGSGPHVLLTAVLVAVAGYLAILGVFFIYAVMRAPVNLDQQRQAAFIELDHQRTATI